MQSDKHRSFTDLINVLDRQNSKRDLDRGATYWHASSVLYWQGNTLTLFKNILQIDLLKKIILFSILIKNIVKIPIKFQSNIYPTLNQAKITAKLILAINIKGFMHKTTLQILEKFIWGIKIKFLYWKISRIDGQHKDNNLYRDIQNTPFLHIYVNTRNFITKSYCQKHNA